MSGLYDFDVNIFVLFLLVEKSLHHIFVLFFPSAQDASFRVFGFDAAVDAYAGTVWNVSEERQEFPEPRAHSDDYFIDEGGDEVVCVFEGFSGFDEECFIPSSGLAEVECPIEGFSLRFFSIEFVISHSFLL